MFNAIRATNYLMKVKALVEPLPVCKGIPLQQHFEDQGQLEHFYRASSVAWKKGLSPQQFAVACVMAFAEREDGGEPHDIMDVVFTMLRVGVDLGGI